MLPTARPNAPCLMPQPVLHAGALPRAVLAILLALSATSLPPSTAFADPIVRTLHNGMTVIVDEMHSAPAATVRFYVRTGSIYEEEYLGAGITHFLEHLVSHGSLTRTADQIDDLQEELGNQTNAYTTTSHTCYYMTSAARHVHDMIALIADYLFHPLLSPKDVETQRGVILREMEMGRDDPARQLHELLSQTMFRIHPVRVPVIGYPARLKQITRQDIVKYHQQRYTPDNVVVVAVGDFNSQQVLKTMDTVLGAVPAAAAPVPSLPQEPPQTGERRAQQIVPELSRAYLAIGFRTVNLFHPDMYPLDVLAYVLGHGSSSRLVSRLREDQGLVDSIAAYSTTPEYDAGAFAVTAVLDEERLSEVERAVFAIIDEIRSEPVTPQELNRAKKQKASELIYARASIESWAATLGSDYLTTGDIKFSERYVEGIRRVTVEDVTRVAHTYLRRDNATVVARRAGKVSTADLGAISSAPRPLTLKSVLPNGITLLVREDHRAPMVSLQAAFLGGLRYETPQSAGLGRALASMLTRGTTTRSRLQIAQALEGAGASLSATSGRDSLSLTGIACVEDLELLFSLASDCLRNPAFPDVELQRVKSLMLAAIKAQADDVVQVAFRLALETLFSSHPYRLDPLGTETTVAAITRDQLLAHWKRICQPQGMVLSLFGDITPHLATSLVAKYLGDWTGSATQPPSLPFDPPPPAECRAVKQRHQEQGIICFAFPGPRLGAADRYALDVLDAAFSGINYPGGRLHDRLRGDQLVYATHMIPVYRADPGYVLVYAATQPEKLDLVERIIRQLITEIQQRPLPDAELLRAKRMCISAQEVELANLDNCIQQETLDELFGLGFDDSRQYAEGITRVTGADVQAAARRYLDLDHCVVAITHPPQGGN